MARRKNSAEMLDVLRRVSQEEKAKRARQAQKEQAAEPAPVIIPQGQPAEAPLFARNPAPETALPEEGPRFEVFPARALPRLSPGEERVETRAAASGPAETRSRETLPARFRRSVLSVLAGARSVRAAPAEAGKAGFESAGTEGSSAEALVLAARHPLERPAAAPAGAPPTGVGEPDSSSQGEPGDGRYPEDEAPLGPAYSSPSDVAFDPFTPPEPLPGEGEPASAEAPPHAPHDGTSPSLPAPGFEGAGVVLPARRRLFSSPAGAGGVRELLSRIGKLFVGEEISGGLRKRVEVRLVTLGLYAAVALGAMLAVALIMNSRDADRDRNLNRELDHYIGAPVGQEAGGLLVPVENIDPGPGIQPEVRNVETAPPQRPEKPPGGQLSPPAATTPDQTVPAREAVWKGAKAPGEGFYVQVQSLVSGEHAELIVAHLQALGFERIWQWPSRRPPNTFIIRLGPYPSRPEADAEKKRFLKLIEKSPLKRPRIKVWEPYVLPLK